MLQNNNFSVKSGKSADSNPEDEPSAAAKSKPELSEAEQVPIL
jgi:hypothetical protein